MFNLARYILNGTYRLHRKILSDTLAIDSVSMRPSL